MINKARELATLHHANQKDPDDTLHIDHVARVAGKLAGDKETTVAWLHDILEDTDVTKYDLEELSFPADVISAVVAITRQPSEEYDEYLERVVNNQLAHIVKISDVMDNLGRSLEDLNPRRRIKYFKALEFLLSKEVL